MRKMLQPVFAAVFAMGLAAAPVAAQTMELSELSFGVDPNSPPFTSVSPSGDFQGFDIDLGRAICGELKVRKCTFVAQPFASTIPALKAGRFDAILSSMTVTPARQKQIAFSSELYYEPSAMIVKNGSGLLPTAASLQGKSVGVEAGTIEETYAKTYWAPNGVTVVSFPDQEHIFAALLAGRIDASLGDAVEIYYGFLKTPQGADYEFAGDVNINDWQHVLGSYIAIGVRKDDPALLKEINWALAQMHASGEYKQIEARYFSFDIYAPPH